MEGDIRRLTALATKLALENSQLRGRLQERASSSSMPTFRDVVGSRVGEIPVISGAPKRTVPRGTFAAVVDARNGEFEKGPDGVGAGVVDAIQPVVGRVRIRNIWKTRDGVVIEAETGTDLEKILKNEDLRSSGLVAATTRKHDPRIIIYDVPSSFKEADIKEILVRQNEDVFYGLSPDAVKKSMSLKFCTGKRGEELNNCVLEVSSQVRNILRRRERVFIDVLSCSVCDYHAISRCYRCQTLGHIVKSCKAEHESCGVCAEDSHATANCRQKEKSKTRRCALCRRAGMPFEHSPDSNCPMHKAAIERLRARTDYG